MKKSVLRIGSAGFAIAMGLSRRPCVRPGCPRDDERRRDDPRDRRRSARRRSSTCRSRSRWSRGATLEDQHADSFQDYLKLVPGLQLDQSRAGQGPPDHSRRQHRRRRLDGRRLHGRDAVRLEQRPRQRRGPRGRLRHLRPRPDRGPARAAGHVLRRQLAQRRAQVRHHASRRPSGLEVRGRAGVETTEGGEHAATGNLVVNVPLADIAAFRASGFYRSTAASSIRSAPAAPTSRRTSTTAKSYGGRASLLLTPSDAIDLRLTAVLQNIDADAPSLVESDPDTLEMLYGGLYPVAVRARVQRPQATGSTTPPATSISASATLTSSTSYSTQKQDLRTDYTFALSPLIEAIFGGAPTSSSRTRRPNRRSSPRKLRLAGESARRRLAGRRSTTPRKTA